MRLPTTTLVAATLGLVACGGGSQPVDAPRAAAIRLEPRVAAQQWYRSLSMCGQGPYEIELPVSGARWGEEFELRVHAPRPVEIQAVILADGDEVGRGRGVYTTSGASRAAPDNSRCVAGVRERLVMGRPGGGGGSGNDSPGTPGTPGVTVITPPPAATATPPVALELDTSLVTASAMVVRFGWRDGERPRAELPSKIRIRFWSVAPNDLAGVLFGVARIEWRPNVPEAQYEAFLADTARRLDEEQRRREDEQRRREEEWRRQQAAAPPPPAADDAERRRIAEAARVSAEARLTRWRAEAKAEHARRMAAEAEREQEARRRAIAAALTEERKARRKQFCATHPEDRDCWGAGGLTVHLDLERRQQERERYCTLTPEDVRCWDARERARRGRVWKARMVAAQAPPRQPDGPPPAAVAETAPPKLSANAEWRPGYWHWSGTSWFWLAGMWRVPESDIAAEHTTVAPAAPPALQTEQAPPPPVVAAVWIPGFWQWSGTAWVWVAGSWQLRPEARATWRPAEWRVRGSVHVLIPGGWIPGGRR